MRNPKNLGFGATSNRGLRAASGHVRIVLNSDARFTPGAMERLAAACSETGVGIAGPRLVFADGSHQTSAAAFPTLLSVISGSFLLNDIVRRVFPKRQLRFELGMAKVDHDHDHDVDWVKGACLAITSDCFAATHGFDEAFYMYVEEVDLCWRAREAGLRVRYVSDARVVHLGGGSTGDPSVHAQRLLRSEARFWRRMRGDAVIPRLQMARFVGAAVKIVLLAAPALFSRRACARLRWQWSALTTVVRGRFRNP